MSEPALVDTHCHFDLFPNPRAILEEAERNRIYSIAVTNTPSVFEPMRKLAEGLQYVRPALGLHPELAIQRAAELPIFDRLVAQARYIGEVGLDYKVVARASERARQRSIFENILQMCSQSGGRVLTIHSRRAEADVVAAVQEHGPGPFILHWYSGPLKTLGAAVESGAYFSVNSAMTKSERGLRIIKELPQERLLTESDGPFIELNGRPCSPVTVQHTIASLAEIWRLDIPTARQVVFGNLCRLIDGLE